VSCAARTALAPLNTAGPASGRGPLSRTGRSSLSDLVAQTMTLGRGVVRAARRPCRRQHTAEVMSIVEDLPPIVTVTK